MMMIQMMFHTTISHNDESTNDLDHASTPKAGPR
jgi:hypothetical protein